MYGKCMLNFKKLANISIVAVTLMFPSVNGGFCFFTISLIFIAIPLFCQVNCFRMVGIMVRLVNSINMGPLLHFICCEVSSLIRKNPMQNTMTVGKVFCKSTNGNFSISTVCRGGKSISRVSVHSSKNKTLPLP